MDDKTFHVRIPKRWVRVALIVATTALIVAPLTAIASHSFTDVPDTNTFHADISWLADAGITKGCNPPANTEFCPGDNVSRGQMSAFMRRFAQFIDAEDGTPAQADNADKVDGKHASQLVAKGEANSVTSAMATNESGTAQTIEEGSTGVHTAAYSAIASAQISVPADGYVLVIGKTEMYVSHQNGSISVVEFGVSTSSTDVTADQDMIWQIPTSAPSGSYGTTVSTHKVYPVSAGVNTFYLVARSLNFGNSADAGLTLIYLSTAYGTVQTASASGSSPDTP